MSGHTTREAVRVWDLRPGDWIIHPAGNHAIQVLSVEPDGDGGLFLDARQSAEVTLSFRMSLPATVWRLIRTEV